MILELEYGKVEIQLFQDIAPNHVKRIINLSEKKEYDGVVFHRVIDGFMAQTGDVQFGNTNKKSFDLTRAGTGSSNLPDLKASVIIILCSFMISLILIIIQSPFFLLTHLYDKMYFV